MLAQAGGDSVAIPVLPSSPAAGALTLRNDKGQIFLAPLSRISASFRASHFHANSTLPLYLLLVPSTRPAIAFLPYPALASCL